jgi:hypothetical protein
MQRSRKALEAEIAKMIVDKAEKAISVQPDLEWWSVMLESLYGGNSKRSRSKKV